MEIGPQVNKNHSEGQKNLKIALFFKFVYTNACCPVV